jgi:hypothetical protein
VARDTTQREGGIGIFVGRSNIFPSRSEEDSREKAPILQYFVFGRGRDLDRLAIRSIRSRSVNEGERTGSVGSW